jgi:EmrB/QacA subfamily drug resistance transporter
MKTGSAREARWSLVVAILGSTMAFVDGTVVNVALPVMQRSLDATIAEMQWIVEAYAVVLAALVLVGGALGDRLGRRNVFISGVVVFALASTVCGVAPEAPLLIAARAVQGIGAALLVPGSLSLISAAFPEKDRGAAIGTWSSTSAMTSALGPVLGGWLVAHASWRWLFFINLPVGLVTAYLALARVPESRDEDAPKKLDAVGATLAVSGLGLIVLGLVEAPRLGGWRDARTLCLVVAGVAVLLLFIVVEIRSSSPMVPMTLFRSRTFAAANALTLLLYAALGGALFFVPFNLIQVQGYSPAAAGAALLPTVICISAMSPWTGKWAARRGPKSALVVGPLLAALGFALLARPAVGGSYWTTVFPGLLALGLGMGTTVAPLTTAVMGAVPERHTGVASGVNNAVARAASVLAVAALGGILTSRFDSMLDRVLDRMALEPSVRTAIEAHHAELAGMQLPGTANEALLRRAVDDAFVDGYRALMLVCSALAALGAVVVLVTVRSSTEASQRT